MRGLPLRPLVTELPQDDAPADRQTDGQADRQTSFQVLQEHSRTAAAPFGSTQGCSGQSSSPEQLRPARVPGPEGRPVIVPGN